MRAILLALALVGSSFAQSISITGSASISGSVSGSQASGGGGGGVGCGAGYTLAVPLTLATAASTDLANFAYPYPITYKALATTGNGGSVQYTVTDARGRTRPADAVVCSAASGGSLLKFYFAEWNSTTGFAVINILESPLHALTNDTPYLFIGNSSVTTNQSDYSLLTDAGITEWCHFDAYNCDVNNATASGSSTAANVAGQVGGALSLTEADSDFLTLGSSAWPGGNNITVMSWLTVTGGGFHRIASNLNSSGNNGWLFSVTSSNQVMLYEDSSGTTHQQATGLTNPDGFFHVAITADGSTFRTYLNGDAMATGTAGAIGTPSQNVLIGKNADGTGRFYDGFIDELLWANNVWSADKIDTLWGIGRYSSFSKVFDVSGVNPAIRQMTGCAAKFDTGLTSVCTLPVAVTSASNHKLVAVVAELDGLTCSTAPTSLRGFTYTLADKGHFTGTIHNYYACIYTAPISSSGPEVLTLPTGNSGAILFEAWNVTTSGMVTTNAGNTAGPPAAMSATSPGANSLLFCGTKGGTVSTPTSNSEGYTDMFGPLVLNTDHPALVYAAWGLVGTGTQTCTLAGTFTDTGVMIIMPKN